MWLKPTEKCCEIRCEMSGENQWFGNILLFDEEGAAEPLLAIQSFFRLMAYDMIQICRGRHERFLPRLHSFCNLLAKSEPKVLENFVSLLCGQGQSRHASCRGIFLDG